MNRISLEFRGYMLEANKCKLENEAGIYCVYAGVYNKATNNVTVQRLLYIGKAFDINERIGGDEHDHLEDFRAELDWDQTLMYSRAFLSDEDERTIAEAALIYCCRPPVNKIGKDAFRHGETNLVLTGKHVLLASNFTVHEDGSITFMES